MGRKSIKIAFIEDRNDRMQAYRARAKGLLKKVHEIGVLCGINISIIFNNIQGDLITYSNNSDMIVLAKESFNANAENFKVDCFTPKNVSLFFKIEE